MTLPTDREILIKIKEGEIDHFTYLVKKYLQKVTQFVSQSIRDHDEREDIVQNTFLNYYKSISRIDATRPVLPYLLEVAKNEVRMHLRRRRSTLSLNSVAEPGEEQELYRFSIAEILRVLSQKQQRILQLISEGYKYAEIAKLLRIPVNTIKTEVRRARQKIQKTYGQS